MDPSPEQKHAQLRSGQTLTTIAFIAGPVSLVIGGVLLSCVALVCSCIAYSKIKRVLEPADGPGSTALSLLTQSRVAIVVSIVTLVLNGIAFIYLFGILMEMVQSGDYTQLMDMLSGYSASAPSSGDAIDRSVWD